MSDLKMGVVEAKFADIIWDNEPISTKKLIQICEVQFEWKRTTTYTVLKRLCDRGIFLTDNSIVTSLISKEDFYAIQSENFVTDTFKGSLPAFLAAFSSRKSLSDEEIHEIQKMINMHKEKNHD